MSLLGSWPASAGLPEPRGQKRKAQENELADLVQKALTSKSPTSGPAPVDQRLENFLSEHLREVRQGKPVKFPEMVSLHKYGMARAMSFPKNQNTYGNPLIKSYKCQNGVLHNPVNDKRTTVGVFHIAEGGLPIADDKKAVPLSVFNKLLDAALNPPEANMEVPFTAGTDAPSHAWVKFLSRPLVCPEVPGFTSEKRMEFRLMAPGSMVANVDFVESVFGNAGEACLPDNDAALDAEGWSGQTGCLILAPHLLTLKKKDLGLPQWDAATDRQRRDIMAWKDPEERYNNGGAFKICCLTKAGVFVTLLADNYFGYCKKDVKTQLSFACNLFGSEEEHAGGALACASISWGKEFREDYRVFRPNHHYGEDKVEKYNFRDALKLLGDTVTVKPEGYAIDKQYPDVYYVPEDAVANSDTGRITWRGGEIFLVPGVVYIHPSGYQFALEQTLDKKSWHIVGTVAEPMHCHKPSTVSGGGKSEISKLLSDMITFGHVRIDSVKRDLAYVDMILRRDYSDRFPEKSTNDLPILDPRRTMGSIVRLLTPAEVYTDEYNEWLETIPPMIRSLVFFVKNCYEPSWGRDWQSHFTVQVIDGRDGDVIHMDGQRSSTQYLRIGKMADGRARKFQLRFDFVPAAKIQTEDDITASVVVPRKHLEYLSAEVSNPSLKFVKNCELRLFQRPDDAIIRGCDTKCEEDMAAEGNFISNFQPLTGEQAAELKHQAVQFSKYTEPMQRCLSEAAAGPPGDYVVSSAHFRIVNGKPTANPRYLQVRTDFGNLRAGHIAEVAARLRRRAPSSMPAHFPVTGVLPGRRNNPPDHFPDGTPIRPLAVYNPLHYQELPELFMDFITSVTGKSPSTTGAGSEGSLTKGPFNALTYVADLNSTLVGWILTGYGGFSSAAGYIGRCKVDHDISLLVPELWCRMSEKERDPAHLIKKGYLEKVADLEVNGQVVQASRLGYRINAHFVHNFMGRIFNSSSEVFDEAMLRPESQDFAMYVDGVNNIVEAQTKAAEGYLADGSIHDACPPLRAVLYCMAKGKTPEGDTIHAPEVRKLFTRECLLGSEWYQERLATKQRMDMTHLRRVIKSLKEFLKAPANQAAAKRLGIEQRLARAESQLFEVSQTSYMERLVGTVGAEPSLESDESKQALG